MGSHMPMPMPPMPPMPMPPMSPMPPMPPMPMPMPMPGMAPSSMANNSGMNMDMGMSMHSTFYWGKDAIILFQGWPNDHLGMYILALIFVFLLSFSVEILSILTNSSSSSSDSKPKSPVVAALIHAVVYSVKMALAYLVMLALMSFNIGVFIVAVIGHAAGGFLVKYWSLVNHNQQQQQGVPPPTEPLLPLSKPLPQAA